MSYRNFFFRKIIIRKNRSRLKNTDFTLFANNCNGGCICHDLGLQFRSPFINLYLDASDYMKFLENPKGYLEEPLEFISESERNYPVALLGDLKLHFVHYSSPQEAEDAWNRRKARINWDNLFVLMSDQDGCTYEMLRKFDQLPYKNKAVFTHIPYPDISSAVYIPGFEEKDSVGNCDAFVSIGSGKKYFDAFDYVKWFNDGR